MYSSGEKGFPAVSPEMPALQKKRENCGFPTKTMENWFSAGNTGKPGFSVTVREMPAVLDGDLLPTYWCTDHCTDHVPMLP